MTLKLIQKLSDNQVLVNDGTSFKVVNFMIIDGKMYVASNNTGSLIGVVYRLTLKNERQLNAEESEKLIAEKSITKQVSNGQRLTKSDIEYIATLTPEQQRELGFVGSNLSLTALQKAFANKEALPVMTLAYARHKHVERMLTIELNDSGVGVVVADSGSTANLIEIVK